MTRDEIRLRALRAAAAVSLTTGLLGCAAAVEIETGPVSSGEQDNEAGSGDGSTSASTSGEAPIEPDAGVEDAAPAADATADATADAQVDCSQASDLTACCEQQNWSPEAGCMAWGPPMPPAMEVA